MLKVENQDLRKVLRSDSTPPVPEAKMGNLIQTKVVRDLLVQSALSCTGSIVLVAETAGNMIDRAVDEYDLRDIEEESMTVSGDE